MKTEKSKYTGCMLGSAIGDALGKRNATAVVKALRDYKKDCSRENLDLVLVACLY